MSASLVFAQVTWENVQESGTKAVDLVVAYVPNILAALGILILGWLLALILAAITRSLVRRTGLSRRLGDWFGTEPSQRPLEVDRAVGKGVFYLTMLFVLVGFFQVLGLTLVTEPLNQFLNQVFAYLPQLVGAALLLIVAWALATVLRFVVRRALEIGKVDRRLRRQAGVDTDQEAPLTTGLSEATYWLTFLLFLPAILDAVGVPGLLVPVQAMVGEVLAFLPNLLAAGVILLVGWFFARVLQRIIANLLAAVGTDRLGDRVGMSSVLGRTTLSSAIALVAYVLILLPVLVAALNALEIEAVTAPASQMLNTVLAALPGIFAAVLVIAVAYVVGRVVGGLVTRLLHSFGFDRLPTKLGLSQRLEEGRRTPSEVGGGLVVLGVILLAVLQALPLLGFDAVAALTYSFLVFAGQVLLGLAIFAVGLYLARIAADAVRDSAIHQAHLLAALAQASIIVLAGAMGLRQMGVGNEIILVAFALGGGAIAIAAAVAFGIGGRDAAKDAVDRFYHARVLANRTAGNGDGRAREPGEREPEREVQQVS
jgi:hypothetical protein